MLIFLLISADNIVHATGDSNDSIVIVGIVIALLLAILIVSLVIIFVVRKKNRRNPTSNETKGAKNDVISPINYFGKIIII